jgi:hypothetical protein
MILRPGPGLAAIILGLGLVDAEFVWARRLLNHINEQGVRLRDTRLSSPRPDLA